MLKSQTGPPHMDTARPHIKGKVIYEIFHNTDNLYTVSKVKVVESTEPIEGKEITVVGYYPSLIMGETYIFWGKVEEHPRFGQQYKVDFFQKELPEGREGLIRYLSSDLFPGVGEKTAERIVETLGEEAISLILEDPAVLEQVPRLNETVRQTLRERLLEYQGLEQIMVKLGRYGIGLTLAVQIYRTYGDQALFILEENPYQLMEEVEGIGFKRADAIARTMGVPSDSPERIKAACLYVMRRQSVDHGHVYVPLEQVIQLVLGELNGDQETEIQREVVMDAIVEMVKSEQLILEEESLYLPSLFFAEKGFARRVKQLLDQRIQLPASSAQFLEIINDLEKEFGITYAASQRQAIEEAITSNLLILTGGPGTGKTTVIKGIVHSYARLHQLSLDPADYIRQKKPFPFLLVAPTGRAAKRLEESTGIPAFTIHRLLGWKGGHQFEYDEEHRLDGKLLIVDEVSMMDQWLANQLFRALPDEIQVVLVGDQDQLPSVGPGQVLTDLLLSEQIPVVQLEEVFRQGERSTIISLAHQIKAGQLEDDLHPRSDFRYFSCRAPQVVDVVTQICHSAIKRGYTAKEIQVLAPMYRGSAGIHALNEALQETFNPPSSSKKELSMGDKVFRTGDKVLQLVNHSEENVFNGDIGQVIACLDPEETGKNEPALLVQFEEREVRYLRSELNQLALGYCCSIHKAQGSEYPIVIIPIVNAYWRMLNRNLLYTAVTRGKEVLIFCGEQDALEKAVAREETATRFTGLKQALHS